jgi:hypothetical protein
VKLKAKALYTRTAIYKYIGEKMSIENNSGVHSKERLQYSKKAKTTAEKYAEHHQLSFDKCESDKVHEVTNKNKVVVRDE